MPQFDIACFYPQITFFVGIYILLYVFLTKNVLPKISQNLKLNKRIGEIYNLFAVSPKGLRDLGLLSYIYKPSKIVSHLIFKETLCIIVLNRFLNILTFSYISSLNWLNLSNQTHSKVRLLKLNRLYLHTLHDLFPIHQNYNTRK